MAWRGNVSKSLKELRILLCQSSPASASARTFVEKNYKDLKSLNPKFPFLIRECSGIQPQMWARYESGLAVEIRSVSFETRLRHDYMGVERCVNLDGMSETQILKSLEDLVKAGGATKA
ncbi:hypothetical protein Bca4012_059672 [Brassica carinata]